MPMKRVFDAPRLLGTLLVVSLAVNLFSLGGWATIMLSRPRFPPPPHGMIERVAAELSPADAAILRQAFAPIDDAAMTARTHRDRVELALRAEPFDRTALVEALQQETSGREAFARQLGDALVHAAEHMSPDGRRTLARAMLRPPLPPAP
jgi:uncharacterized membrane protein